MDDALPASLAALVDAAPDPVRARALLLEALTHRTFVNEQPTGQPTGPIADNQRLELLGDAVLELVVTRALYDALPHADEGLLSRARAALVNEAALAGAARAIALGGALRLGRGEVATGGRERARTLADAFEAVIAASYLAAGIDAAAKLVDEALGPAIAAAIAQSAPGRVDDAHAIDSRVKDPKSMLQEIAQRRGGPPPTYEIERAEGPVHDRVFHVRVQLRGEWVGRGEGKSRRDAEMRAAMAALEHPDVGANGTGAVATRAPSDDSSDAPPPAEPEQR